MTMSVKIVSSSKEMTQELGSFVASFVKPGEVILLTGDLGAGKTTFAGGLGHGFGLNEEIISPTFNILKCYFKAKIPMYHIDAYRLEGQNLELGLEEYIEGDGVCLIEWPQYIESLLPDERLEISIHHLGGDNREFNFSSTDKRFDELMHALEGKYLC